MMIYYVMFLDVHGEKSYLLADDDDAAAADL